MIHAVAQDQTKDTAPVLRISVEFIAYAVILTLSLLLRTAELDSIPLTQAEAHQALASWHIVAGDAPGVFVIPDSPLLFTLNNLAFTIMGSSETAARLFTALAGVLLILTPLLFRDLLGRTRALVLTIILACSPAALIASRFGSPAVWSMLFAIVGLWALWRYWQQRQETYAIIAAVMAAGLVFLAEPGGILLLFILLLAGALALWLSTLDAPEAADMTGAELLAVARARLAGWPVQNSLFFATLAVVVVATGFMFYPAGVSALGQVFNSLLRGLSAGQPGAPGAFPLMAALFYEPFLWVFAGIAMWLLYRRRAFDFVERFLLCWVGFAVLIALLYPGGTAAHALWLIIPLAGLTSYTGTALLVPDEAFSGWDLELRESYSPWPTIPAWAKWGIAAATLILLAVLTIHFQVIGRSLMSFPVGASLNDALNLLVEPRYVTMLRSIIWLLLAVIFIVVGYLLTASLWGNLTAAQGVAGGVLIFGLLTSLGSGWTASVPNADNPVELWHVEAVTPDAFLLRETLFELAQRETDGFRELPIAAVAGPDGVITGDGVIAWLLRDYVNAEFVPSIEDARGREVVLTTAPVGDQGQPNLGTSYVGQRFVISKRWHSESLEPVDFIAWWSQRQVRIPPAPVKSIVLWARQDVFNGSAANSSQP